MCKGSSEAARPQRARGPWLQPGILSAGEDSELIYKRGHESELLTCAFRKQPPRANTTFPFQFSCLWPDDGEVLY